MSRRIREETPVLSLDSFLDIVTNVVGVLILVAVVTVLGASDIGVSAGASALSPPRKSAARVLFECSREQLFLVDEKGNTERVQLAVSLALADKIITAEAVTTYLEDADIGDRTHRVRAQLRPEGLAWIYALRPTARGEPEASLDHRSSTFQRTLDSLEPGGFVYFVVHDDSFAIFRKARDLARARGISIGWHPALGEEPIRLSTIGSLGKRIQ